MARQATATSPPAALAAVLAGGLSRRFGQQTKALLPLAGKPLIEHVIHRLRPQCDTLVLSVDEVQPALQYLQVQQVCDPRPGSHGPLGGLLAAMQALPRETEWLAVVPCDAPFLPSDLIRTLLREAKAGQRAGALIEWEDELQPTFSVWHQSILPLLEDAVLDRGLKGFKQFLRYYPLTRVSWPAAGEDAQLPPFFNINNQQDLDRAEALLRQNGTHEC